MGQWTHDDDGRRGDAVRRSPIVARDRLIILAGLATLWSGSALPADVESVPRFPVDQICASRYPAGSPGVGYCVEQEQGRYDVLQLIWRDAPSSDREKCVRTAERQPMWNYGYLYACIDAAIQKLQMEKMKTPAPFKYK